MFDYGCEGNMKHYNQVRYRATISRTATKCGTRCNKILRQKKYEPGKIESQVGLIYLKFYSRKNEFDLEIKGGCHTLFKI